jgi:TnpA family transposase
LTHPVDIDAIIERWDDLLRVAASLKQGTVTASLLVARLQAAGPQHPVALALREYGRLIKTLFVLRYLADETERRAIGRQLNKGEALHALHERIFFADEQRIRVHTLDRQSVQAHCLHLIANAIITWNTIYMTHSLDDLDISIDDERLGRLSPALYAHICRTGTYNFDVSTLPVEGLRPLRDPQAA